VDQQSPVITIRGATITFPGVRALDGVDFRLYPGEIHALMGENGAGKSTLIKALTGVYQLDSGEISIEGTPVRFTNTSQSQAAGISTVYQEVNLVGNLTVAENVMLGHEPRVGPFINWRAMRKAAQDNLRRLHLDIDPGSQLSSHVIGVQQLCAIARATSTAAKVLILDEPTSSLDRAEVEELFSIMRELKAAGVAILFVSHFLEQVYEIADRITVLRNGGLVGEWLLSDLPRFELISHMVGKSADELNAIAGQVKSEDLTRLEDEVPLAQAIGLGRRQMIEPFDLELYEGEVVGLVGLLGSGRTELARLLYGADRPDSGELKLKGQPVKLFSPRGSLRKQVAYSTEDRKREGVVGDLTVRENIALALQARRGPFRPIPKKELDAIVETFMTSLDIHPANPDLPIKNLSGGNQQKVLLARWLATAPELLILDEPLRGIDVGTKAEIQRIITDLAHQGMSIVFISSELEEILRVCHRIAIMRDRHKIAEVANSETLVSAQIFETIASGGRTS
jgi:simple sugar transport system ATP-binding protein